MLMCSVVYNMTSCTPTPPPNTLTFIFAGCGSGVGRFRAPHNHHHACVCFPPLAPSCGVGAAPSAASSAMVGDGAAILLMRLMGGGSGMAATSLPGATASASPAFLSPCSSARRFRRRCHVLHVGMQQQQQPGDGGGDVLVDDVQHERECATWKA